MQKILFTVDTFTTVPCKHVVRIISKSTYLLQGGQKTNQDTEFTAQHKLHQVQS